MVQMKRSPTYFHCHPINSTGYFALITQVGIHIVLESQII